MKKPSFLSLFWKFTIAIVVIVALFGYINLFFINNTIYNLFEKEINHYGINNAKGIADNSVSFILYDDIVSLDKMVSNKMKIDSSVAYIIILDSNNKVLAHTFDDDIPQKLLEINNYPTMLENIVKISKKKTPNNVIRDMAVPILQGNLGKVRIGIFEEDFVKSIHSINSFFLSMVVVFLFFGILGALIFSYIITLPIKEISQIAENLNLSSLKSEGSSIKFTGFHNTFLKFKKKYKITDEIDVLTNKFEEMVIRLQKTYEELQYTQASLVQSEKMASLGTLSAGVAHEINNPISGIQNCIRRLEKSPDNIKQNILYLELMSDAVNKIETVVSGLLNFSRKNDFNFEDNCLNEKIENVLFLTSYELEKSQVAVKKEYTNHNYYVYASSNHIEQVLLNLVLNSIDAINEKKQASTNYFGEIKFNILEFENDIVFSISDNGIGISSDKLNSIFDPFFTQKKIKQGTGLGLTICYSIIEQHGGNITASINSNLGLTISVKLPKKKEQNG